MIYNYSCLHTYIHTYIYNSGQPIPKDPWQSVEDAARELWEEIELELLNGQKLQGKMGFNLLSLFGDWVLVNILFMWYNYKYYHMIQL